jgi:dTDP-4-dehydrorhamnose reductase
MKVLITGHRGQLGDALLKCAPAHAEVTAIDRDELDLTQPDAVTAFVNACAPDLILNAAAYTAVDRAETDQAAAQAVNGDAVGTLAGLAHKRGAKLVHISTDFVFGDGASRPIPPDAPTNPLGVYGATKLDGEHRAIGNAPDALVIRTAWVYAPHGGNFVKTMLRLMGERPEIRVVADQIGAPTYAPGLAAAMWKLADVGAQGIMHYSDAGAASWYDFAVAIQEEALAIGLLDRAATIVPIRTEDYPTPARRPSYSLLDSSATWAALGGPAPHWRTNLRTMLQELLHG